MMVTILRALESILYFIMRYVAVVGQPTWTLCVQKTAENRKSVKGSCRVSESCARYPNKNRSLNCGNFAIPRNICDNFIARRAASHSLA